MENQEVFSYNNGMFTQINQNLLALLQNQTLIIEQYNSLDKKIDTKINELDKKFEEKIDALDKKFEAKIDALDKKFENRINELDKKFDTKFDSLSSKIDNNFHNIIKIQTTLTKMQKDISDLRTDVDVVYDLEIDSRKKIKALQ